jgi:uncharacterized membrane protein
MKSPFFLPSFFACATLFLIWLVSLEKLFDLAIVIFIDLSSRPLQTVTGCLPPFLASLHAYKTRRFTCGAAVISFIAGVLLLNAGLQYFCSVLAFYMAKSALIFFLWQRKLYLDHHYPPLDVSRILVEGLSPALLCTWKSVLAYHGSMDAKCIRIADVAFLSYVACCTGHGFSSELSSIRSAKPRLVTSWRIVVPGIHGAVTLLGIASSAVGGGFVGLAFSIALSLSPEHDLPIFASNCFKYFSVLGMLAGLLGSLFGSLLGATLQFSGIDIATNKVVHANGCMTEHIAGIDLVNSTQCFFLASSLTSAAFASVAWLKFSCLPNDHAF